MNTSDQSDQGNKAMGDIPVSTDSAQSWENTKPRHRSEFDRETPVAQAEPHSVSHVTYHESQSCVEGDPSEQTASTAQGTRPRELSVMEPHDRTSARVQALRNMAGLEDKEACSSLAPVDMREHRTESQIGACSTESFGSQQVAQENSSADSSSSVGKLTESTNS